VEKPETNGERRQHADNQRHGGCSAIALVSHYEVPYPLGAKW
jgi:hypothetical protein